LIPETQVAVIERCSGHGGSWGIKKGNFDVATKFAKQTVDRAAQANKAHLASECPLAGKHIAQGLGERASAAPDGTPSVHPIQIFAKAYGF
ncbi:MAG: glycerol-3-phosphate dehydrogenase, partial [Rhodospirillaceae bacterium]|nr:glycerol-3-phosphate dehydrogenase [Rhodospirillaceae bacterium]